MSGHVHVTGFDPFADVAINPSATVLQLLPSMVGGREVRTAVLPVDTEKIEGALQSLLDHRPAAVLHLGVARDRSVISIETTAVNSLDFDCLDNAGRLLKDQPIISDAESALPSRLPVDAIVDAWRTAGIDSLRSHSAGRFLCNQVFYLSLARLKKDIPSGFIHLAPDAQMAPKRHQALKLQADAIGIAMKCIAQSQGWTNAA